MKLRIRGIFYILICLVICSVCAQAKTMYVTDSKKIPVRAGNHAISSIRKWMDNHEIEEIFFTGSKPIAAPNIHEKVVQIIEGICQVEREYEKSLGFQEKDDPEKL